jgi:DNA-directed RNA polymerase subunit RPC12/RpoP
LEGDPKTILDVYGNNAAVLCPSCSKPFVFSAFLNKRAGRVCPHCNASRAFLFEEKLKVEELNREPSGPHA